MRRQLPWHKHQFSTGHGITKSNIGLLELYSRHFPAQNIGPIVVIGSGSGLVPMFLDGLRNSNNDPTVFLIDAGLPSAGFGHPWGPQGWAYSDSDLHKFHYGIIVMYTKSEDGLKYFKTNEFTPSYIFIDANHDEKFVLDDLNDSSEILAESGRIILHDANLESVDSAIQKFLTLNDKFRVIEQSNLGAGVKVLGAK